MVPEMASALTVRGCEIKPYTRCIGADLSGADLAGAELNHAVLHRANLRGANLTGAHLSHADVSFVIFSKARLNDARLDGASLTGSQVDEVQAHRLQANQLRARDVNFAFSDLTDARISHSDLRGSSILGTKLLNAHVVNSDLRDVGLRAEFSNTHTTGSRISEHAEMNDRFKGDATAKSGLFYHLRFILLAHDQYGSCTAFSDASSGSCTATSTGAGYPGFEHTGTHQASWTWSGGAPHVFNNWARVTVNGVHGASITGTVTSNWHRFDVQSITGLPAGVHAPGYGHAGHPGGPLAIDLRSEHFYVSCGSIFGIKCRRPGYQMHMNGWLRQDYTGPVPDGGYSWR